MSPTRRQLLQAVGAAGALGLAGCAGDGDSDTTTSTSTTTSSTTTTTVTDPDVAVATHDELGDILVDGDGMTLYMFDNDTRGNGSSTCYEDCAGAWPPLTVDGTATAGDGVTAELTTFNRDGGATQVAANGWPLYGFAQDSSPGDANGQAVGGVWWVLGPDGTPKRGTETTTTTTAPGGAEVGVRTHDSLGDILVDGDGMTLYMFDNDTQGSGESSCTGGCASSWPPLTTSDGTTAGSGVTAELSTFERGDGSTQVAANGWPLYGFAQDSSPGDANGQGASGVWWVLGPDGTPIRESNNENGGGDNGGGGDGPGGGGSY